ncbi:restriction endonuclease [Haloarcula marina]|uniref:restriction endonuclease n=1 Tax=Haloarcula marina TaxID=2961574 RepID=UPI0020B6B429|nr:restriction endonuclease [Halomicroarcula marina]
MTGIVIFTAGREDAYQDYLRSVKDGYEREELDEFLPEDFTARASDDEPIRVWGTSVANKWQRVSQGDIVLVYREGGFIAQARVLSKRDDLELAEHLYDLEGNPWDLDNPWQYLTFFTDFEEIDIDVEPFNDLVGYEPGYRPQGFIRVADDRIERVASEHESVETAVNELTDSGPRVHIVDDDPDDDDEEETADFGERLVAASENGDAYDEFEQLVAEAFSRLGFDAQWIEGGDDTDVQLTEPVEAIVEVKARGNGQLQSPDASRIRGHQESRGAEYAVVVAPGFTPAAIDDANRDVLVLVSADRLRGLVERHEQVGLRPEFVADVLFEPGAFQDDRLDEIDEHIAERRAAAGELVSVMEALERGEGAYTAGELRHVLTGMLDDGVPDEDRIRSSLVLLAHPSLGIVVENEEGYELTTTAEQGVELLEGFGTIIE